MKISARNILKGVIVDIAQAKQAKGDRAHHGGR
jgi:molybdopterin-binding protein